jgi:D-aminoacyl-tRNA deacylase
VELFGGERVECPGAVECYEVLGARLGGFDADSTELEMLDSSPDPGADAVIVLSRHRSESGRKSLTVHHPGNPTGDASLGGEPYRLARAYPALAKALLRGLARASRETGLSETHEVTLEATHHGPTRPEKPIVYVELGSTEEDWRDRRGWETLALAVKAAMDELPALEAECVPAAGFGGTHYPQKHTRIQMEGRYCVGHVIPRYAFDAGVPRRIVAEAMERSYPSAARVALVEKKSLKAPQRKVVLDVAGELGVVVEYI